MKVAPLGIANVGWKFYMLFVTLNLVDFVVIALFFPETKGKSLEEMNQVFGDAVNPSEDSRKYSDEEKSVEQKQ